MKRKLFIILLTVSVIFSIHIAAFAKTPSIKTAKTMYLLDPYYWVYGASKFTYWWPPKPNPHFWPEEGHEVEISYSLTGFNNENSRKLLFEVEGLTSDKTGVLMPDTNDPNIYIGSFNVTEADVGGELFKPGEKDPVIKENVVPKALTVKVSEVITQDELSLITDEKVFINRWGCDRCHLDQKTAKEVYPGCAPPGGPLGPHYWGNVLGRNAGRPGFSYENLTNASLTHTPTVRGTSAPNPLDRPPYHQRTNMKQCGNVACSPCHQGSDDGVRAPKWRPGLDPYGKRDKSLTVKCTFCHGIDGGYVPDSKARPRWEDWYINSWQ